MERASIPTKIIFSKKNKFKICILVAFLVDSFSNEYFKAKQKIVVVFF